LFDVVFNERWLSNDDDVREKYLFFIL